MPERQDDRRAMLTNWYKMCGNCGRKVHYSKRYPERKLVTCLGCHQARAIGDMPDVPESERAQVGKIIDRTPKPEGPKKLGGLQG